jgi:hypothetical protein
MRGTYWAFTKLPTLAVVSHIDDFLPRWPSEQALETFFHDAKPIESAGG